MAKFMKEIEVDGYTLKIFKENNPGPTDYKIFAEVNGLEGCFVAGDSESQIIKEAPGVINLYLDVKNEADKK